MAADDKTEKPTAKRRQKARDEGQVARSVELSGSLVVAGGLLGVVAFGPRVVAQTSGVMRSVWGQIANGSAVTSAANLHGLMVLGIHAMLATVAPIAGICLFVGVLANVAQVGFRPRLAPISPDFKRLDPAAGAKRIFGKRVAFETGKSLAKVLVVGAVTAITLVPMLTHEGTGVGTSAITLGELMSARARTIVMRSLMAYLLISIADYAWQKRTHDKSMMMSKQEVKDEAKQTDLPPEVKGAIRRRQIQAARARMMAAVPEADVIVTNPTHYAVALRYDGSKPAPIVVAKGKNLIAAQIRRIAGEHDVPIVPDPPLARSLHASVDVDQMIPAELYAAVAQVLAFVYRMAARRRVAV